MSYLMLLILKFSSLKEKIVMFDVCFVYTVIFTMLIFLLG